MLDQGRLQRLASRLQRLAQPPVDPARVPLVIGRLRIGSVGSQVARLLCDGGHCTFDASGSVLVVDDGQIDVGQRSRRLATAAQALQAAGLLAGWRDEVLDVRADANCLPLAQIERAACRPLGIATTAVHLNAYLDDDTLVVAQRSHAKQIDPGLWDNLVGGMVPAGESLQEALRREAWEEAGLSLRDPDLQRGRWFLVRRPVPEGLQSEIIHVFDVTIPSSVQLANQDGEVAAIEARPLADIVAAIERGEFTLEAGLATIESLTRRRSITTPAGLFHCA